MARKLQNKSNSLTFRGKSMSNPHMFIDGIGHISITDGVVRFDLVGLVPGDADKMVPTKVGGMAMTMPGFLRTVEQLNQVVNKLLEQGVLKRNEPQTAKIEAANA
jgi:hypothetical protein